MLKQTERFLVVRLDGKVISAQHIDYDSEEATIELEEEYLTEEDILYYYEHLNRASQLRKLADVLEAGKLTDTQEAMDMVCKLSRYSIKIEKQEIEF